MLLNTLKKNDIQLLPIDESHIIKVKDLPLIHKDLFDRIIVAQAIAKNL